MLTPRRETFATGLAQGFSQAEAYRRAFPRSLGWKDKSVWEHASVLAADDKVSARVADLMAKAAAKNEVTIERVVAEMAKIAFFDVRRLVDNTGAPIAISTLDDSTAGAIVGLDVARVGNADIGVAEVMKFKLADKKGALDSLMRHLGGFNADKSGQANFNVHLDEAARLARLAQILAAAERRKADGGDKD